MCSIASAVVGTGCETERERESERNAGQGRMVASLAKCEKDENGVSSIERLPRGARERERERKRGENDENGARQKRRGSKKRGARSEKSGGWEASKGSEDEGKKRGIERDRAEQGRSRRLFVPPPPPPPDKNRPRSCSPSSQNGTRLCVHGVPGVP